jgi:hypothetical protein
MRLGANAYPVARMQRLRTTDALRNQLSPAACEVSTRPNDISGYLIPGAMQRR